MTTDSADFVFYGGAIFTPGDPRSPTALAVREKRIVGYGSDDAIRSHVGQSTETIDLGGGLLTPGFIDSHAHTATSGLEQLRLNFDGCHSLDDALGAIAQYVAEDPGDGWVLGGGWSQAWFERGCPDKESLDSIVGDRPTLLTNSDGHGAWANTAALGRASVDDSTPDPSDGRIERNEDGSPQGTLHEGARQLVAVVAPSETVDDFEKGLIRGQQEMLSWGITGWQDAAVTPEVQEAYRRVAEAGLLLGDVVAALWWDRDRGLDQIEELVQRRTLDAPGFRPTTIKLMLDGVAENFTASVLDPYLDQEGRGTENRGIDFIDPDGLKEIVSALDEAGFQCHFHALGDRAVRNALDALEHASLRNGPSPNRHNLAHLQFVHPDDIVRFARLGAIANVQPLWACNDDYQVELTRPFISAARYGWQYPFGSLLRSGARMGMGSDWNVSTANVMAEIDVAVTRTDLGRGEPLGVEEKLTGEQALSAFTSGSAYINGVESDRGSITIGNRADLVVLDQNPLQEGVFRDTRVRYTLIGGEVVFDSSSARNP